MNTIICKNISKRFVLPVICLLIIVTSLMVLPQVVSASPGIPNQFYGTLTINGAAAAAGYTVTAKDNGVDSGASTTTDSQGRYGYSGALMVQGNQGDSITFFVNGVQASQTATFQAGAITNLALTVSGTVPANGNSSALSITTSSFYAGAVGNSYSQTLAASGGSGTYTFTITSGSLPAGLTLGSGGSITGTPTTAGTVSFTAQVSDSAQATSSRQFDITIDAPAATTPAYTPPTETTPTYTPPTSTSSTSLPSEPAATPQSPSTAQTSASTGSPAFADYSFSELTVAPQIANAGDQITATVRVVNSGNGSDSKNIVLKVNDINMAQQVVQVDPGKSQYINFTFTENTPGTYSVTVEDQTANLQVQAAPAQAPAAGGSSIPVMVIIAAGVLLVIVLVVLLIVRQRQNY
ncbi:MAG: putative Ig domain-containing protein [Dehalococcoidia bacterium]